MHSTHCLLKDIISLESSHWFTDMDNLRSPHIRWGGLTSLGLSHTPKGRCHKDRCFCKPENKSNIKANEIQHLEKEGNNCNSGDIKQKTTTYLDWQYRWGSANLTCGREEINHEKLETNKCQQQ